MKMQLAAKLMLLGATLAVLQLGFGVAARYKDTPSPVRLGDRLIAEGCDVIYLGESTLYSAAPTDRDQAPINEMVQRRLPAYRVGCIAHDAFHMELYERFFAYFARKPHPPSIVVVPINLATVNPYWDKRPEYQFERFKRFLEHDTVLFRSFYRPLAAFRALDLEPISQREYARTVVFDGDTPVGRMDAFMGPRFDTFSVQNTRDQLIVRYMYRVPPDHRKLEAMRRIARISTDTTMQVLFYVTPIDCETGDKYLGKRFTQHVTENVELIVGILEDEGIVPLDLSRDLGADMFHWASLYPNEHLDERGRRYVADKVAEAIRERLDTPSVEPTPKPRDQDPA